MGSELESCAWSEHTVKLLKQQTILKTLVTDYEKLLSHLGDLDACIELSSEEPSFLDEAVQLCQQLEQETSRLELLSYFDGPWDQHDCYLRVKAGQGGKEAQAWTAMIRRMYLCYAEQAGFKAIIQSETYTDAGIRESEISICGHLAFGMIKHEAGVHRLQRISPFDPTGNRQTSFCRVEVTPQIDDDVEIDIDWDKEVKRETFGASSPGGQNANRNFTGIRFTHIPTGISAQSAAKSQLQNVKTAKKTLLSRLYAHEMQKRQDTADELRRALPQASWGNHSRTYVLDDKRVKDHRINYEEFDVEKILNGRLQPFIDRLVRAN